MNSEIEDNKLLGIQIREEIESLNEEERYNMLNEIYSIWEHKGNNIFDYLSVAIKNFGLDPEDLKLGKFEKAYKLNVFKVTYLHLMFTQYYPENSEDSDELRLIKMKFNKLKLEIIIFFF